MHYRVIQNEDGCNDVLSNELYCMKYCMAKEVKATRCWFFLACFVTEFSCQLIHRPTPIKKVEKLIKKPPKENKKGRRVEADTVVDWKVV